MKRQNITFLIFGVLSAVLMSLPFLIPHCGFFALFGLVPLLCMERIATMTETKRFWWWHYGTFVLWNAITTFWVCNATVGGGVFAVFANALQMSLVFWLFRKSKKHFKGILPYIFLVVTWIAWEKYYFDLADISWPWLVLGNAFAQSIKSIQWYEFTGTLGGSLWVWMCNLAIFGTMVVLSDGTWQTKFNNRAKLAIVFSFVTLFILPFTISKAIWKDYQEKEDPMEVLIVQPNIDPYNKFQALTQRQQDAILIQQIEESLEDRHVRNISDQEQSPLLIVAPETFTSPLFTESIHENTTWRSFVHLLKSYPNVNMLFGASAYDHIQSYKAPSATARHIRENLWLESHNSALNIDGKGRTDLYHKSKLVVAVEMTPYPAIFCKLDDMLGGVMGRCIGQDEVTLMQHTSYDNEGHISKTIPYGSAICYESVYGDYYADYVEKGARFMTIITNDAWWGDTPGYKQHLSYASLRAIETRRSIARCANTGLSAIINQRGEITAKTNWWKQETLRGTINMNDEITFFTKYGDIIGRVCTFLFVLLLLSLAVRFRKR